MTDIYEESKQQAINDINEYGRTINIVSVVYSGTDYDPTITKTNTPVKAVQSFFLSNEIDGTNIKATDKKYLIAGNVTLTTDMKILDGGIEHSIINVLSVKPGDTLVLSKVQARI